MDLKTLMMADPNIQLLMQVNQAMGMALNSEQLAFVQANYQKVVPFLYSDAGKAAFQTFILEWMTAPTK